MNTLTHEDLTVFEGMTSISSIINSTADNDRKIVRILYDESKEKALHSKLAFLRHKSEELNFDIISTDASQIDSISTGTSHGGIVAICTNRNFIALDNACIKPDGFYVMLEGIEDPYNFGYALRSLYAAGVDGIILDRRNWMSAAGVVARASAGASERFPVFLASPAEAAEVFHSIGYTIVCADIRTEHLLEETDIPYPVLLVVGGERRGISRAMLDAADLKVRISYGREFRASLSAASAATILAYEIFRQNRGR